MGWELKVKPPSLVLGILLGVALLGKVWYHHSHRSIITYYLVTDWSDIFVQSKAFRKKKTNLKQH